MLKYCVYLTIYSGNKLPPFYIGYCKSERIIFKDYHGSASSKKYKEIWQKELLENPSLFKTKILKFFEKSIDAATLENKFQLQLNVVYNPLYINQSSFPHFSNETFNEEHKLKISQALKGKPKSRQHIEAMRQAQQKYFSTNTNHFKGKTHSLESKIKMSTTHKGVIPSLETRHKMSQVRFGNKNSVGKNTRPIIIGDTKYTSVKEACQSLKWHNQKVQKHATYL